MRHGGKILSDQLVKLGVRRVFSVPGESFLAALDGLYDSGIQNVVCRHEGGAAMMAEAHGKMTGQPGVCFVTRGPGAPARIYRPCVPRGDVWATGAGGAGLARKHAQRSRGCGRFCWKRGCD